MKLVQQARSAVPDRDAFKSSGFQGCPDEDDDREFSDFIESISLSEEEFAAFLTAPESSVPEVKRLFAERQNIGK